MMPLSAGCAKTKLKISGYLRRYLKAPPEVAYFKGRFAAAKTQE
jgi:hypothetical protein